MTKSSAYLREPLACAEEELRDFARLVRQGFNGSDEGLPGRIRQAKWLAFLRQAGCTLTAIAALKAPNELDRKALFEKAEAAVDSGDYGTELGWVFVAPDYRGNRIATDLCTMLLERANVTPVFSTTRVDNIPMTRILLELGFTRVGKPFLRRKEELVLFLRPYPIRESKGMIGTE